jgi:hypothetical protein
MPTHKANRPGASTKTMPAAWIGTIAGAVLFCGAAWILHHELATHRLEDILMQIRRPMARATSHQNDRPSALAEPFRRMQFSPPNPLTDVFGHWPGGIDGTAPPGMDGRIETRTRGVDHSPAVLY